jgi:hypothetical protein
MTRIEMSKDGDYDVKYTFVDPKACSLQRSESVSHSKEMHQLFKLLQDFVLLVVRNYFRENGGGLSEQRVQDMLLHMTNIIAHSLKIEIKMCDGRSCPKLVLANGKNVYAGCLDLFGLMNYSDLEVVAFIMEVKAKEVRSGQQCTQLMNQIQAVSARQTEGCNYTLNDGPTSVSAIGMRMCEAVHSNGVVGSTLLCLGPESSNPQEQPARSVFFIETATNTFRHIADALVRAERTRAHCVEKNKLPGRSSTPALPSTPGSGSGAGGSKTGQPPTGRPGLGLRATPCKSLVGVAGSVDRWYGQQRRCDGRRRLPLGCSCFYCEILLRRGQQVSEDKRATGHNKRCRLGNFYREILLRRGQQVSQDKRATGHN